MKLSEALASIDAYEANRSYVSYEQAASDAFAFVKENRTRLLRMQAEDDARAATGCGRFAPVAWLEGKDDAPAVDMDGIYIAELVVVGEKWKGLK